MHNQYTVAYKIHDSGSIKNREIEHLENVSGPLPSVKEPSSARFGKWFIKVVQLTLLKN